MQQRILGLILCLTVCLTTRGYAAETPSLEPLPDIPPPPSTFTDASVDEAGITPDITIVQKQNETVEEYRVNGQLYLLKVTPKHGVPYYMHREQADGNWITLGPLPPLSIPQWVIFKF